MRLLSTLSNSYKFSVIHHIRGSTSTLNKNPNA